MTFNNKTPDNKHFPEHRYSEDTLTKKLEGRLCELTFIDGSMVAGVLERVGVYDLLLKPDPTHALIIMKNAVQSVRLK